MVYIHVQLLSVLSKALAAMSVKLLCGLLGVLLMSQLVMSDHTDDSDDDIV